MDYRQAFELEDKSRTYRFLLNHQKSLLKHDIDLNPEEDMLIFMLNKINFILSFWNQLVFKLEQRVVYFQNKVNKKERTLENLKEKIYSLEAIYGYQSDNRLLRRLYKERTKMEDCITNMEVWIKTNFKDILNKLVDKTSLYMKNVKIQYTRYVKRKTMLLHLDPYSTKTCNDQYIYKPTKNIIRPCRREHKWEK